MKWPPFLSAILVILLSGMAHGILTHRWSTSQALVDAVVRLQSVPRQMGDWNSEDIAIPDRELQVGEIAGYLSRRYTRPIDGAPVNVLIVCGHAGPIAVHTPDVCFRGAGFQLDSPAVRESLLSAAGVPAGDFWYGDFLKPSVPIAVRLDAHWSWSNSGEWIAPVHPRVQFASSPFLYKLYVTRATASGGQPLEPELCRDFLKAFLPELNQTLFPKP